MRIRRITISVPEDVAARVKRAAGRGSVSSWVTGVIEEHLDEAELERLWQDFYRSVRPGRSDVRRANDLFLRLTRRPRRNRAA